MRHRILKVRASNELFEYLETVAERVGLDPAQVAAVWLHERVSAMPAPAPAAPPVIAPTPAPPRAASAVSRQLPRGRGLHDEILSVLEGHGEPMSVAEIAAAIRDRDQYRPPRSDRGVEAAVVSRRVSNPQYRSLFERAGRKVKLSDAGRRAVSREAASS